MGSIDLLTVVTRLKELHTNIYKLNAVETAEYMKLKNIILDRCGILVDDDILSKTESEIIELLNKEGCKWEQKSTEEVIDVQFPEQLDIERNEIRKQIMGTEVVVKISQSGRTFNCQWNKQLTVCKVTVPSNWDIEVEQALLLRLYDNTFQSGTTNQNNIESTYQPRGMEGFSLPSYIRDLVFRFKDFSSVWMIVNLEVKNQPILKQQLTHLDNGANAITNSILQELKFLVQSGVITLEGAKDFLGFRSRLIKIFEDMLLGRSS